MMGVGEDGVEILELGLGFMSLGRSNGKGKQRQEYVNRVVESVGANSGFLCEGGDWEQDPLRSKAQVSPTSSVAPNFPDASIEERKGQGVYCWSMKDHSDWRVFWLGGSLSPTIHSANGNVI
jgi:hypothetical protein